MSPITLSAPTASRRLLRMRLMMARLHESKGDSATTFRITSHPHTTVEDAEDIFNDDRSTIPLYDSFWEGSEDIIISGNEGLADEPGAVRREENLPVKKGRSIQLDQHNPVEKRSYVNAVGKNDEVPTAKSGTNKVLQRHKPSRKLPIPTKNKATAKSKNPAAACYETFQDALKNLTIDTERLGLDSDTRIQVIENLLTEAIRNPETCFSSAQLHEILDSERSLELKRSRSGTHLRSTKSLHPNTKEAQPSPTSVITKLSPPAISGTMFTDFLSKPQALLDAHIGPPATFYPFPRLPTELRLAIWEFARPEPQIVRLRKKSNSKAIFSTAPFPAILHICSESRNYALHRWYQLNRSTLWEQLWTFFFDPTHDFMYTSCDDCLTANTLSCRTCGDLWPSILSRQSQRIILNWSDKQTWSSSPFSSLAIFYAGARDVILLSPRTNVLKPGTQLSELEASSKMYSWQNGKSLREMYLEEAQGEIGTPWASNFQIENLSCMELAVTEESSKRYGFLSKKFENMTLNFNPPDLQQQKDIEPRSVTSLKARSKKTQRLLRDEKRKERRAAQFWVPNLATKKLKLGQMSEGPKPFELWGKLGAVAPVQGHYAEGA